MRRHAAPAFHLREWLTHGSLMRMSSPVALARCPDYASVPAALSRVLSELGGVASFVKAGQSVLIKPNLLSDALPEEAVTTHPEVVRALIRLVKAEGAKPWVADSPADVVGLERVWEKTGFRAMCAEEGVPLVALEKAGSQRFDVDGIQFTIARPVLEADAIISVPKVKTHVLAGLTAGVKNLYGTVPGYQKTALHKLYPRQAEFSRLLLAVYRQLKPVLTLADAVVGMEGNGPSGGTPVQLGFLAASPDAVALDTVLCRMLKVDVRGIVYLGEARRQGVGETDPARMVLLGDSAESLAPLSFVPPATLPTRYIPRWLVRLVGRYIWHHPAFTERCVSCGQCVRACPVGALSLAPRQRPVLSPAVCIECCCCHEVCPAHAIEMEPSPLVRLIRRVRSRR